MARPNPLDLLLDGCAQVRGAGAGTAETSFYPALKAALDAAGAQLKPSIFALHHPTGRHAGIPDFGLFEAPARRRAAGPEWRDGVTPERGVVEVKGVGQSIDALVAGDQVRRYAQHYGLVLATNLWQFRLVDAAGSILERFDAASSAAAFWTLVHGPRPDTLRARFADFLERCLLTRAPLTRPAEVARFLASYARDARETLADQASLPALRTLRENLEKGLGLTFDQREGESFFRSTLVQTLFYGLFSAWVAHHQENPGAAFSWRQADWSLHVPVMRLLFRQVSDPDALLPLGLAPLLDAAQRALGRVDRDAFFTAFAEAPAVQHFYEPFLEYFDPQLRKQLGVWYTPPEIVTYQVERVDRLLRTDLGVRDGLADESVWVLDPCCGTGSYVLAVLERIRATLSARGMGDLMGEALRRAATTRVVGFEIMPAPYVIAHWQVGEFLARQQSPLAREDRAAIYLTNALTGWDADEVVGSLEGSFAALDRERNEARTVKQARRILVVLGNPPYNAFAGTSPASERGLVDAYKKDLNTTWGVKKFNLDDLYVRFFRIAERRVAEATGQGIVSFITNYSWLSGRSYVVMRQSLMKNFGRIWIENLHGDRTITEYGPDGRTSETVFAIEGYSVGIRQGVAIATLLRSNDGHAPRYLFRDDIDASKASDRRAALIASLTNSEESFDACYEEIDPQQTRYSSLRPGVASDEYAAWVSVADFGRSPPLNGLMEKRGGALIDEDRSVLTTRLTAYLDPQRDFEGVKDLIGGLGARHARFDPRACRDTALRHTAFNDTAIVRYVRRVFDTQWAYVTDRRPIWNEPRPQLIHLLPDASGFFISRPQGVAQPEGFISAWSPTLVDNDALRGHAYLSPVVDNLSGSSRPNLSDALLAWAATLGLRPEAETARLAWHHALAVTYSQAYLAEHAPGIRQGWPRVPLPDDADLLRRSAALGSRIAALLNADLPVDGVTSGNVLPQIATIGIPTTRRELDRDWRIVGWGYTGREGVTMPGRGEATVRAYGPDEAATAMATSMLGERTLDIAMNGASYWRNIPESVWEVHIGGYQVLKKWLSYRDVSITGRSISADEVAHFQSVARRIAAILLMGPELDANFRACAAAHRPLVQEQGVEGPGN